MKNLDTELEDYLRRDELISVSLDVSEIALDKFISEGLLKDIPVLNSLMALYKSGVGVKEALFVKKLLLFLAKIQDVPSENRKRFLIEISEIEKNKKRFFEKLILTIDRLDDSEKSTLLGKIFKHLIVGNIRLVQYYRISRIIEDMMIDEINCFFYEYGYYEHNDLTNKQRCFYMDLIGKDNLKEIMIRNGLYEVTEKLVFVENIRPQQYKIEKKEKLTRLGELFAEFGFESRFYLKHPIG